MCHLFTSGGEFSPGMQEIQEQLRELKIRQYKVCIEVRSQLKCTKCLLWTSNGF